jgi:SHS2 domain-containing protein
MHEVFAHTADIGLRARATTLNGLFGDAATGLFALIVANLVEVHPREELKFELSGRAGEYDYLLFDWLNELLFTFDSRRIVLSKFEVNVAASGLEAAAWGEPLDLLRHQLDHEVKAITYHGLKVVEQPDGWLAEVIVDI